MLEAERYFDTMKIIRGLYGIEEVIMGKKSDGSAVRTA